MNFNEEYMSNEIKESRKSAKNKNKCENCIHKVVCALWEIQNELIENNCIYYLSNSILNNRGNNNAK